LLQVIVAGTFFKVLKNMLCPVCNTEYEGPVCPYASDPMPANAGPAHYLPPDQQGDGTGGVIPYKNPKALLAYYLGILSGIPFIGLPFGIASFVLGIQGLKARKRNPIIKGSIHAGIGIGCGFFFTLLWTALIVGLLFVA
jgi:hypothetical protein